MGFFITNHFGVVAAAIQGNVDCEDYISHFRLRAHTHQLSQSRFEVAEIRRFTH
jgi:hypothetical protein